MSCCDKLFLKGCKEDGSEEKGFEGCKQSTMWLLPSLYI